MMKNYDGDGGANRDLDELERERNGGLTGREIEAQRVRKKRSKERLRREQKPVDSRASTT